jgi:uncharacterized protein (TIGR03066 family)
MNQLRIGLAGLLLLGISAARADDKKDLDRDKLVGVWKVTKGETLEPGTTWTFTRDGKATVLLKNANGTTTTFEGTYKIKGQGFTITGKLAGDDYKETFTVPTLTDKELILVDEDGKKDTCERSKGIG